MNSLIEAYKDYKYESKGLNPPESVKKYTDDYFQDQDIVHRWMKECTKRCFHKDGNKDAEVGEFNQNEKACYDNN